MKYKKCMYSILLYVVLIFSFLITGVSFSWAQDATPAPTPVPAITCQPVICMSSGYVRDSVSAHGISGATVTVTAELGTTTTTTDSSGFYEVNVSACMIGEVVTFTVTAPGYQDLIYGGSASTMGEYDFNLDPEQSGTGGDVWFVPEHKIHKMIDFTFIDEGMPALVDMPLHLIGPFTFTNDIHLDSGSEKLTSYSLTISFDTSVVVVNTKVGTSGVSQGDDGFITAVNASTPGELAISGFDAEGTGPGSDLHVLTIHWYAQTYEGTTELNLYVESLLNQLSLEIGNPLGHNGYITIETLHCVIGDVNGDGSVDIVDALLVAQWYVGLISDLDIECGDVDQSGSLDIVDALMIAQYYVGIITSF
jgi:hypothetical protein